jgi:ATP-dependent RNA helicase DDX27
MGLPEVEETSDEKKAAERKAYFSSIIDASAEADGDGSKKSKKVRDGDIGSSFSSMTTPLSRPLLLSLSSLNLSTPTPVQKECIPVAMMGKDIVASCVTGGGKTVAFWVGVLERCVSSWQYFPWKPANHPPLPSPRLLFRDRRTPATRVLVLCPTRELAVQVHGVGKALARYMDLSFCLCVGEQA